MKEAGMETTQERRYKAKKIQRYHFKVFGGKKSTAVSQAVANIAARFGCDRSREGVLAHIAGKPFVGTPQAAPMAAPVPKIGREFYETWEWKEARFVALKRHGRQCQCCGWTPGSSTGNHLVVDHIKPLRTHPQLALDPDNHQVLCNDCNMGKSYKHHDDFR